MEHRSKYVGYEYIRFLFIKMGNPFQSAATAVRQEANFEQGWGSTYLAGVFLCVSKIHNMKWTMQTTYLSVLLISEYSKEYSLT